MFQDNLLSTWEHFLDIGTFLLILFFDGSGRIFFDRSSSKAEQGVSKMLSNVNDAK
jgi:hypothetical protein